LASQANMNRLVLLHGFTQNIVQFHNYQKALLNPHYSRDGTPANSWNGARRKNNPTKASPS
jgi:hypothetical protein